MLTFQQFLIEPDKKAKAAALMNARGFISEHTLVHSFNHYHGQRRQGKDHSEALKSVSQNLKNISKQTIETPDVQKVASKVPKDEFDQTVSDSHEHAMHLIDYLHRNEGGISGPSVATRAMQKSTIEAHYGQKSAADVLVPVNSGPHTHVGLSVKYSTKQGVTKINTPGAGVVHEHLQDLYHKVFGQRNPVLQKSWEGFSDKLKGSSSLSPESEDFIFHLRTVHKERYPTINAPTSRRLVRHAGRDVYGKEYKFDYANLEQEAETEQGERGRKAYQELYSVKKNKDFIDYSSHAEDHFNQIIDHINKTGNPKHIEAFHHFIHKLTNTNPNEHKIKTLLSPINRGKEPSDPIPIGPIIGDALKQANGQFRVSRSKHSIKINFGGMAVTWARSDPDRGNPVNISAKHLKGK